MQRQGDEVHIETDEARGASSPNIVRWVLLISLFGAIVLLSIIWMTGAATQTEEEGTVSHEVRDRADVEATDSIVGENADRMDTAEPGSDTGTPTVENNANDEPAAAPQPEAT